MATGPFYGRKESRRRNGSIPMGKSFGGTWHRKLQNVHRTDGTDGYAPHSGLFDMRSILAMTHNDGYHTHGSGISTTSTQPHHVYGNVVNYTTETFGGGGGQGVRDTNSGRGNQYGQYSHGGGNKNQSNGNSYASASSMQYFFSGNDMLGAALEFEPGYGGYAAQGVRDTTSPGAQWRYRQIVALTYTGGGYKDGSPWRQIHRSLHHTDQTTNLGNLMDYPGSYCAGANNATTFFVWSTPTDNAHSTATTRTSTIHMFTDTGKSHNSNYDMYNSRQDLSSSQKELDLAFQTGAGSSNYEVFNLVTETKFTQFGGNLTSTGSAFMDKDKGYHWDDSTGSTAHFYTFTYTSTTHYANHGQQKGLSSKTRMGLCGNEGSYSGGYNWRRWNLVTDTNTGTIGKIETNMGEENYGLGQDWQYMIGNYDGAQNNENHKMYYATDTGNTVSGLSPSANAGQSSGHCAWRA